MLCTDPSFCATSSNQKLFLSWQSKLIWSGFVLFVDINFIFNIAWDNLRIDVHGFCALCKYFFDNHPGYFLSPLRISGSAVETLFGQYKYMAGAKLDASNYSSCRSKYLAKQAVHHSGKFYRDQQLSIPVAPLQKKNYGKKLCASFFMMVFLMFNESLDLHDMLTMCL